MKRAPLLLGMKRKKRSARATSSDIEEEEGWDYEYDLLRPEKVVIADDTNGFQLFGDKIFTCPQEDLLEGNSLELPLVLVLRSCIRFLRRTGFTTPQLSGQGRIRNYSRN